MNPQPPKSAKAQLTILVVDDEPAILMFVTAILAKTGLAVLTAGSGEDAIRQSQDYDGRIDLLLSNIQMPGMTGIELGTKLNVERPEMKVLLMSGFTSGMLVLDEGWHFLHKPFLPAQLRDLISSVLRQSPAINLNEHGRLP